MVNCSCCGKLFAREKTEEGMGEEVSPKVEDKDERSMMAKMADLIIDEGYGIGKE